LVIIAWKIVEPNQFLHSIRSVECDWYNEAIQI